MRVFILCLGLCVCLDAARAQEWPSTVTEILAKAEVPLDHVALVVREVGARDALIVHNAERPMNPASVMKLVTTYAALDLLGPAYSWKTEVSVQGELRGQTLYGDLIFKGSGDPKLTVDRFWALLRLLRDRGLQKIQGDLVLDRGAFEAIAHDPARFDGEALRAYNVGPDALLLNFKTVRFFFAPALDERSVAISPDVKPLQLDIVNRVRLIDGPCGDWRERIKLDVQPAGKLRQRVTFTGSFAKSCGERVWNVSLLDHPAFFGGVFADLWQRLGGEWEGAVKLTSAPTTARLIAVNESPALSEIVRDINKYSNNVMARQLLLALSPPAEGPASVARATETIVKLLERRGVPAKGLVIENGSGLSRSERISAATLAGLLDTAYASNLMPDFVASLSRYGADGTFRRGEAEGVAGNAYLKSGTLNDVRAMAGYVQSRSGRRYLVVFLIHHANAPLAQGAQAALLNWIWAR